MMQLKNEEDVANGDVGEVLNIYKADGKSRMRVAFWGWKNHGIYRREYGRSIWLTVSPSIRHRARNIRVILPMLTCFYRMLRKNLFSYGSHKSKAWGENSRRVKGNGNRNQ